VRALARTILSGASHRSMCAAAYGSRSSRWVGPPRGVMLLGEVPVVAHRRIEVGTFVLMRARAASRAAPHPALPNETLQLTGASAEVVVVAARLVDTLSQLHLSSGHAARS
jgi:hypothetical protein